MPTPVTAGPVLLRCHVDGIPVPEGSLIPIIPKHSKTGRPIVIADNKAKLGPWRTAVKKAARAAAGSGWTPLEGPVWVRLDFAFPRPKTHALSSWPIGTGTVGDLDKLQRAILDALTGVAYRDDAQVVLGTQTKLYGPRAGVAIYLGAVA